MPPVPPKDKDKQVGTTTTGYIASLANSHVDPLPIDSFYISIQIPSHPNDAVSFFQKCLPHPEEFIARACSIIDTHLYGKYHLSRRSSSVCVNLHEFDGLAHTSDSVIHLSLPWIGSHASRSDVPSATYEFKGVILHELVHVLQFDGGGTAPWWWIEGLADYVRLRGGLGATHWKKEGEGGGWEDGYDTTAVFFNWIQRELGDVLQEINARLETRKWDDGWWQEITGSSIQALWKTYKKKTTKGGEDTTPPAVPTEGVLKVFLAISP